MWKIALSFLLGSPRLCEECEIVFASPLEAPPVPQPAQPSTFQQEYLQIEVVDVNEAVQHITTQVTLFC